MFLDQVSLTVQAGAGGDGAATFRREAHVPRGGPDGGDGGRGGSVYLIVDVGQTLLTDYRYKHHFRATPGAKGERSRRHGKAGRDLELKIPPGTVAFRGCCSSRLSPSSAACPRAPLRVAARPGPGTASP